MASTILLQSDCAPSFKSAQSLDRAVRCRSPLVLESPWSGALSAAVALKTCSSALILHFTQPKNRGAIGWSPRSRCHSQQYHPELGASKLQSTHLAGRTQQRKEPALASEHEVSHHPALPTSTSNARFLPLDSRRGAWPRHRSDRSVRTGSTVACSWSTSDRGKLGSDRAKRHADVL